MKFFAVFFCLFTSSLARAEYRVYLLSVTDMTTGQIRQLTSTLDDIQYRGYYSIRSTEQLVLTDTWMCWGRQGDFLELCRNPHVGKAQPAPTASSAPPSTTP